MRYFETFFMVDASEFIESLDKKVATKVLYNIDLAEQGNDVRLFKKLKHDIWEFRTKYAGLQVRLLAFWDKSDNKSTLVIATHGFIKKVDKIQGKEIDRAIALRQEYFKPKK